jgi:hypothetical protein
VRSDDGVRVWLDDGLLMDYWQPQDNALRYVDGTYISGNHKLRVEYFERTGSARIRFWWEPSGATTVPPTTPSVGPAAGGPAPTPPVKMPGPWQGEYFDNRDLKGTPVLRRSDATLDFSWGKEAPAVGVGRDNFSVRWSGTFAFAEGRYTFTTYTDDGVRVYVDGKQVINSWRGMRGYRSATLILSEGNHTVKVEYFERTGAATARLWWVQSGVSQVSSPQPTAVPKKAAPSTCTGGPLYLDAWPVATTCSGSGWTATVFVQGRGGNCRYTYAWERGARGGPTSDSMTFEVRSASKGIAIVGEASATSAGQTARVKLHVTPPKCP